MGMKFIRGMIYPNVNAGGRSIPWHMKWDYEFWGFCVNGTSSLTVPGGFASLNGTNFPANFTAGTSLLTSGSDGSHPVVTGDLFSGECVFTALSSTPFTTAMVGKALVMWKPNSDSSEDSIYIITQLINSSQIMININTGGTPNATTKHPSMTARTGVNYRVVDMETGANAFTGLLGAHMVFQMDASSVNPGQANSQILFYWRGNSGQGLPMGIGISGTGSWNGNTFSVTAATNATPIVVTTSAVHGLVTGQTVVVTGTNGNTAANGHFTINVVSTTTFSLSGSVGNGAYTSGGTVFNGFQNDGYSGSFTIVPTTAGAAYTSGQTALTYIADKTFFISHLKEQDLFQSNSSFQYHFEIPKRLYPQGQDLHPVSIMFQTTDNGAGLTTSSTTEGYGGGFYMGTHRSDTTIARKHRTLVKAMRGDGTPDVFGQQLSDYRVGYNTVAGTIPSSDAILCLPGISNQFSLARARLRSVKFTGTHVPQHHRIGLNGEWIQMPRGICWPWDNTIIPFQLLLFGAI